MQNTTMGLISAAKGAIPFGLSSMGAVDAWRLLGEEKGAELFEAIGDMPDAKFDAVVGAAAASYDLEAQRDAEGVQGVEAEVVVTSAADDRVAELKAVVAQRCGKTAAK